MYFDKKIFFLFKTKCYFFSIKEAHNELLKEQNILKKIISNLTAEILETECINEEYKIEKLIAQSQSMKLHNELIKSEDEKRNLLALLKTINSLSVIDRNNSD